MKQGRGGGGRAQQIQTLKMHGRCRDTASDLKNIQVKKWLIRLDKKIIQTPCHSMSYSSVLLK